MTIYDLNEDQLQELKQRYYIEKTGRDLSYEEMNNIDRLVSWKEIRDAYSGVEFVQDDFFSSDGEEYLRLNLGDCIGSREDIASDLEDIADKIRDGYYSGNANYGTSWGLEVIE